MEIEACIDTLNPEEQQAAFDLLWQRLAADSRALNSPVWHGDELANYFREHPLPNPDRIVDLIAMAGRNYDNAKRSSQIQWLFSVTGVSWEPDALTAHVRF